MSLIKGVDSDFYFFDGHARNSFGMPDPDGTAVVLKFADIAELEQFLCALSYEIHSRFFEIVPVQFLKQSSECETLGVETVEQQNDESSSGVRSEMEILRQKKLAQNRLYKLKRKLMETAGEKRSRLDKEKENKKRKRTGENEIKKQNTLAKARQRNWVRFSQETEYQRQARLDKDRQNKKRKFSQETEDEKQIRLDKDRQNKQRKFSQETEDEKETRLDKDRHSKKRRIAKETETERQSRLNKHKQYVRTRRLKKKNEALASHSGEVNIGSKSQQDYLREFNAFENGKLHEQSWAKSNMADFHKSVKFTTYQCTVCKEAWPLKCTPRSPDSYICVRCSRDKNSPKINYC